MATAIKQARMDASDVLDRLSMELSQSGGSADAQDVLNSASLYLCARFDYGQDRREHGSSVGNLFGELACEAVEELSWTAVRS